jgi:hypothetical protein
MKHRRMHEPRYSLTDDNVRGQLNLVERSICILFIMNI